MLSSSICHQGESQHFMKGHQDGSMMSGIEEVKSLNTNATISTRR